MIVKACLNSFVHETDKKLHCLCIPRGLQLTFIHSVMDLIGNENNNNLKSRWPNWRPEVKS